MRHPPVLGPPQVPKIKLPPPFEEGWKLQDGVAITKDLYDIIVLVGARSSRARLRAPPHVGCRLVLPGIIALFVWMMALIRLVCLCLQMITTMNTGIDVARAEGLVAEP